MNIYLYEDSKFKQFYPISCLRPVFLMRSGIFSLLEKCRIIFQPEIIGMVVREQLSELMAVQKSDYPVNIIKKGTSDLLFLNGRIKSFGDMIEKINQSTSSTVFYNQEDEITGVLLKPNSIESVPAVATQKEFEKHYNSSKEYFNYTQVNCSMFNYNWEIMADIKEQIEKDFRLINRASSSDFKLHNGAYLVNEKDIFISPGCEIFPSAVIDASSGPVFLDNNVRVDAQAVIYGPCFVGANSRILAGKVSASSIGHTCRVGGEVEESIFQSYVNKYHDGFIGHSYVGSWVNFGAMTTNSDLKNNYSNIRLMLNGENIDSPSNKVGSFIGDHTKFGIGTLLNTGINIGVCCNIFGGTLVADKEIPHFKWGSTDNYQPYQFEKALETVKIVYGRRSAQFHSQEEKVLRFIYENQLSDDGVLNFNL